MRRVVLSIDIGSTFTKGALFDLGPGEPRLLRRRAVPTTSQRLVDGVDHLLDGLLDAPSRSLSAAGREIPLYACSSAKGGLRMAAIGIVPDLTLHAARLAAASAGAKIVAHYAYRLSVRETAELERIQPDIILFSGGTDGGNEQYNLDNAQMLAETSLPSAIVYAGNAKVRSQIEGLLSGKELIVTDNLMPEVGRLDVEPARACIQEVFLKRIVEGKGLAEISARCRSELKPTPRAFFELLEVLGNGSGSWNDSIWLDLGGATTDFYSCTESFRGQAAFVLRGLREPKLKRTVEGDLGMRVSAPFVLDSAAEYLEREAAAAGVPWASLADYVARLADTKDYLPTSRAEQDFDELLAGACIYQALLRHAGTIDESYTADGKIYVQRGKDLRGVTKWIGSGGYLAQVRSARLYQHVLNAAADDSGGLRLIPQPTEFYADADYLLPLLGNLACDFPTEAAQLAAAHLRRIE